MKRREELIAEAESAGIPTERAELLLDIALEERLDPELGIELVRRGLHRAPEREATSDRPDQPAADRYLPEWMFPPTPADVARWERTLRVSFRRLRSLLEEHADIDAAFGAFARGDDSNYA